jgi:hypothetical protein
MAFQKFSKENINLFLLEALLESNLTTVVRNEPTLLDFIDFMFENQDQLEMTDWFKNDEVWNSIGLEVTAEQVASFTEPLDILSINGYNAMTSVTVPFFTQVEHQEVDTDAVLKNELTETLFAAFVALDWSNVSFYAVVEGGDTPSILTVTKDLSDDDVEQILMTNLNCTSSQLPNAAKAVLQEENMTLLYMWLSALNDGLLDQRSKTAMLKQIQMDEIATEIEDTYVYDFYIRESSNVKSFIMAEDEEETNNVEVLVAELTA